MIKTIQIKNFKSVVNLKLELGRFNVLIGENGCGKSNILEAIAFGAASNADKMDFGSLGSRGIRVTPSEHMYSAFTNGRKKKAIDIDFIDDDDLVFPVNLTADLGSLQLWKNNNKEIAYKMIDELLHEQASNDGTLEINKLTKDEQELNWFATIKDVFAEISQKDESFTFISSKIFKDIIDRLFCNKKISEFLIFNPEQSSLRDFRETTQILPLGIHGEGLFQELKKISLDKRKSSQINEIKELLSLLDWFEDFAIPGDLLSNEYTLSVTDRYLNEKLHSFDQRSTNEGFLYLLFYFTLFVSKDTPEFFAIDNIEASFNPKLCTRLISTLADLSKKKKKQVFISTHNPAVLDGLDLSDNMQRLFVISRNGEGHTISRNIPFKADRKVALSEAWRRGLIGGLPDNF